MSKRRYAKSKSRKGKSRGYSKKVVKLQRGGKKIT